MLNLWLQMLSPVYQEEGRGAKIREISRMSTDEANICQDVVVLRKSLMQLIRKLMEDKMTLSKTEQQLTENINMLKLGISAARASLQELSSSKSSIQTESQVLWKEKELEMARFQRLTLIAEVATAERFAAIELGDLEEADILLAEADAAASEARKLQPLFNFRDEDLSNLPKHFVSMELVSKFGGKQLAELVASIHSSGC